MKILVILFLVNGEWVTLDGWWPRVVTDCEAKAELVRAYLSEHQGRPFRVTCE